MDVLPELSLFLELADAGSFTELSRRLGVPRATLSRRLTRYERALGTALFERSTRTLRLTEAGRLLQARGAPLLAQAKRLGEEVQQVDKVPRGTLVIATQTGLGREFAAGFMSALRSSCPAVSLRLVSSPHPLLDSLDVADVVLAEGPLTDLDWVAVSLGPSDRIAVASPAYLTRRGVPEDLQALDEHELLSVASDPRHAHLWPCRDGSEIAVNPVLTSDDLHTLAECTLAGLGIAMLPMSAVAVPLTLGQLQVVLPKIIGRKASFYVLYPSVRRSSPKIQAFLAALESFIQSAAMAMVSSHGQQAEG
ncbi:MAG: DNA-binding transcriptional LysR family regulator [Cognaticolwellia sp.]